MSCANKMLRLIGASFGGSDFEHVVEGDYDRTVTWAPSNEYGPEVAPTCRAIRKIDVHGKVLYQGASSPLTPNESIGDLTFSVQAYDGESVVTITCANMTPGDSGAAFTANGQNALRQEFDYVAETEDAIDSVSVGS